MPVYILLFLQGSWRQLKRNPTNIQIADYQGYADTYTTLFLWWIQIERILNLGVNTIKKKEKKKTGQACLDTEHILETIPEWFGTIWFQTLKCLASTRQNLGL